MPFKLPVGHADEPQKFMGTATFGFGIASGRAENKYGGSTVTMQILALHAIATGHIPHMTDAQRAHAAKVRDYLLKFIPDRNRTGTINIVTDKFLVPVKPTLEIEGLVWTKHIPLGENFMYLDAQLTHHNPRKGTEYVYDACLYYPCPETKGHAAGEYHKWNVFEAMATEWIEDLRDQDQMTVTVKPNTFQYFPSEGEEGARFRAWIRQCAIDAGVITPRSASGDFQAALTAQQQDIVDAVEKAVKSRSLKGLRL